jgi:Putative lumazine-binding
MPYVNDAPVGNADALVALGAQLREYFDGLHHSDTQRLRRVFHPQAIYATATGGTPLILRMHEYFAVVDQRPSPASRGETRTDCIEAIEFVGPVTVLAKVQCAIRPKHFTDLLTFIHVNGRWQIISKVFHFELEAAA